MTNETKFKLGDMVRLKSGGPRMTVEAHSGDSKPDDQIYVVVWFTTEGSFEKAVIRGEALSLVADVPEHDDARRG